MDSDHLTTGAQASAIGAVFRRCALQVNPHHYLRTFRDQDIDGDARSHAETIVAEAVELGVSVLAITDHNDVSDVPSFRAAAEGRAVAIFPGFELTSSEGIHVLCIYPPDTGQERLGRLLGEFGILDTGPSSNLSNHTFDEVLAKVHEQQGISVAAHVVHDNGLFDVISGQARINAWRSEDLLAIQIPETVADLTPDVRQIVENKNPQYRRVRPVGEKLAVAAVNARDVTKSEDLRHPSATCWIKMSEVSIEGLRQAFLDPGSRIRLTSREAEPESEEHAELAAIAWEGGFLDGTAVHFNPNLNVLIGGRGAGKSTVIESLRYVLGLDPAGEVAQRAHLGIVRQVLRSGTKVSLLARCRRPANREYRIERTVPNPPVIRDETGKVSSLLPSEILPRVEVYGQHEISELARSREKLTRLLDRFVKRDETLSRRKADVRRDLEKTRRSIDDVRTELNGIEKRLAALPGLEETLERYREAGLEERLRERSLLVREERVLDSVSERIDPLRECLEGFRRELPVDRVFLSPKALEGLPGREILSGAGGILERLSREVEASVRGLDEALSRADREITDIHSRWNERKRNVQNTYEKILRELQRSAVDGEEFIRLRSEIENLRPLRERESLLRRLEKEHADRRRTLLAEWEGLKAEEFRLLDRAARKVGRKLRDRVQARVTAAGNREPLFQLLRDEVDGRLSEAIEALARMRDLSLPEFVESCRKGPDAVKDLTSVSLHQALTDIIDGDLSTYSIPPAQAKRLAEAPDEVLMRIEELELPSVTTIRLNTAPSGEPPSWQALDDLSTGQKATAVLLLLLLESDGPLIVDQPEDDLDNRFITEGVVPRMREEKTRRQFIFSTHNANIPVLGDAELILALSPEGEAGEGKARIAPDHRGSIDSQPVREIVEELLEGGKDAFETRRRKYGF